MKIKNGSKIVQSKAVIDYVSTLEISQGQGVGELFNVLAWQKKHLRGALSVKISALSMARANGAAVSELADEFGLNRSQIWRVCNVA